MLFAPSNLEDNKISLCSSMNKFILYLYIYIYKLLYELHDNTHYNFFMTCFEYLIHFFLNFLCISFLFDELKNINKKTLNITIICSKATFTFLLCICL